MVMKTENIDIEINELGLDEIFMRDCNFHIERMTDQSFWIGIDNEKFGLYHIQLWIEDGKLLASATKEG